MTDVCVRLEEYSEDKSNIEALFLVKRVDEELEQIIEVNPGFLKSQAAPQETTHWIFPPVHKDAAI